MMQTMAGHPYLQLLALFLTPVASVWVAHLANNSRLTRIEEKLMGLATSMDTRFHGVETRLGRLETGQDRLAEVTSRMAESNSQVRERLATLEAKVR